MVSLIGNGRINLQDPIDAIQLEIKNTFKEEYPNKQIEEALMSLIFNNNEEEEVLQIPEDFYEGF